MARTPKGTLANKAVSKAKGAGPGKEAPAPTTSTDGTEKGGNAPKPKPNMAKKAAAKPTGGDSGKPSKQTSKGPIPDDKVAPLFLVKSFVMGLLRPVFPKVKSMYARRKVTLFFPTPEDAKEATASSVSVHGVKIQAILRGTTGDHAKMVVLESGHDLLNKVVSEIMKPHGVARVFHLKRRGGQMYVEASSPDALKALLAKKTFEDNGKPCCILRNPFSPEAKEVGKAARSPSAAKAEPSEKGDEASPAAKPSKKKEERGKKITVKKEAQ